MRRSIGLVLIGLGAFFITLAPLVRFYAAGQLITAPTDIYSKNTLRAENATYFDASSLQQRQGVTVTATDTVRGNVSESTEDEAVYDRFTAISDETNGTPIQYQQRQMVFDRHTTALKSVKTGSDTQAKKQPGGIGVVWPFGLEKKTYQYYDGTSGQLRPVRFDGVEQVKGIETYRFVQTIDPVAVQTPGAEPGKPLELPGEMLGLSKSAGPVPVQAYYQARVTMWVAPRAGATVKVNQQVRQTLRTQDGAGQLVIADFDLRMIDSDVTKMVRLAEENVNKIVMIQSIIPPAALGVGILSLLLGLGFQLIGGRKPSARRQIV
jgi:hypothetical protein